MPKTTRRASELQPPGTGGGGGGRLKRALPWLVFVLAAAPFLPALTQGFVAYDDDVLFLNNPYYRGLGAEQLR